MKATNNWRHRPSFVFQKRNLASGETFLVYSFMVLLPFENVPFVRALSPYKAQTATKGGHVTANYT